jgi:hypothetical protein
MKFFDVRSSVEIPDLSAETFDRKLMGAFLRYGIRVDRPAPGEKIIFSTVCFQFVSIRYHRFIFRGVSSGEIEFFNQGKNLVVRYRLALVPMRLVTLAVILAMGIISSRNDYFPLIMAGWMLVLYFVFVDTARYNFNKWFSRFGK